MTKDELKKLYDVKIEAHNEFMRIAAEPASFDQSLNYRVACTKSVEADCAYSKAADEYLKEQVSA